MDSTENKPKRKGKKPVPEDQKRVWSSFGYWLDNPTNPYRLNNLIEDLMFYEMKYRLRSKTG